MGGRMFKRFSLIWKVSLCPLWHHSSHIEKHILLECDGCGSSRIETASVQPAVRFYPVSHCLWTLDLCRLRFESALLSPEEQNGTSSLGPPPRLPRVTTLQGAEHWASASDACVEVTAGWVAGQLWQLRRLLMYQHMDSVLIPAEAHNYQRSAAAFPFSSLSLTWMSSWGYF